ncbi:hypothetical protein SAMN05216386_0489 [Nitrosospira briensis]|uniref:Uncharacterized protein n=1 Tax=Nitrosospira briensis TaxID=35799 RepID=A0A1I4Y3I8_9PROT|nr:hypothetical protein [Nitrosospira briensis]SFN32607.1 hypothetical protein SAMN05216386_0489 [Nitrosospira briensis]
MQANLNRANTFELSGKSIHVTYTSTGISGQPTFSYRDDRLSRSFSGEEIRVADTELGQLITVTLEAIPDFKVVTVTLALPVVTVPQANTPIGITVPGITVTNPTTIGGPKLLGP